MNSGQTDEKKVRKIIPSKLETGFQQFLYKTLGKRIPLWMTPNQITVIGALGGLFGIVCAGCARFSPGFLFGVIAGLLIHLIADDLDGYVARTRNQTSKAGAYLDLITDIMHITYLIIALSWSGYLNPAIAILLVPVYALLMVTCMNTIQYFNEFLFPRLGPIETHLFFIVLCVCNLLYGPDPVFTVAGLAFSLADGIMVFGGVLMYYEMIRMQIQLFGRLKKVDHESKE